MPLQPSGPPSRLANVLRALADLQSRRPWRVLALGALALLVGTALAARLELRTRYDQMLPEGAPSAVEFRRVLAKTRTSALVSIVLEADGANASNGLRNFGDALVPRLLALGPPYVAHAADGVHGARAFLMPRAGLFAPKARLEALDEAVAERWDWEVSRALGTDIGDEPPPITAASLKRDLGLDAGVDGFPDGYFQSADGKVLIVAAHTAVAPGDMAKTQHAFDAIRSTVEAARREFGASSIRVSYAGDAVTSLAEYGTVQRDLIHVGVAGVAMVLAVVLLFFFRLRALLALGLTLAIGLAGAFGVAQLFIGHLNVATGFLFSIIAGNGINFGIIYMARYFEERRAGKTPASAAYTAHAKTAPATLVVAIAAAAAYGSLGVSDFRVFRQFAFIGATGMVACWLATALVLPAILVLADRRFPFRGDPASWLGRLRLHGLRYDSPFSFLVSRAPRVIVALGAVLAVLGALGLVPYLKTRPLEYDMRRLQSDLGNTSEMYRASALTSSVLGAKLDSSMIVLADRVDQVEPLKQQLLKRRDASPASEKPFEAVHTLFDFVPRGQAEKIPLLLSIRERLLRARSHIAPAEWERIAPVLPPADLAPYTTADLPEDLARPFTEHDGTRGRVVVIEPTAGMNVADLRYLLRWADSFRETVLPNGERLRGSGRAVIFADILSAIERDIPRAIAVSLGVAAVAVLLLFRSGFRRLAVLGGLFLGLSWLLAFMAMSGFKINFFNFVALPITFGIGIDYAVNFVQRLQSDPEEGVLGALKSSGGPVILCSLTTILGYLALLGSVNQAIRGLGLLAVIGEVACLLAVVLVLPAALVLFANRDRPNRLLGHAPLEINAASSAKPANQASAPATLPDSIALSSVARSMRRRV